MSGQVESDQVAIREALAAPFPPELVKWRPGSAYGDHYRECQKRDCRVTRDPSKHMQLAYVEDESVMDRLDDVFGVGGWSFKVDAMGDGVVRGTLVIHNSTAQGYTVYEDLGYPSNGSEPMKEAMTDAFRRCGRMVGIARYIYAGQLEQAHRPNPPRPAAPGRSEGKPQPSEPPVLDIEDDEQWAAVLGDTHGAPDADGTCPVHGTPWKRYPAGTSKKTGKPYEAGWSCETFGCREHPSDGWKARHAA